MIFTYDTLTTCQLAHIRKTVREVCRLDDSRPREYRGETVQAMLEGVESGGVWVAWSCFTAAMLAHTL